MLVSWYLRACLEFFHSFVRMLETLLMTIIMLIRSAHPIDVPKDASRGEAMP